MNKSHVALWLTLACSALAFGADTEVNPVRRHPVQGGAQADVQRIIVKFRPAVSAAAGKRAQAQSASGAENHAGALAQRHSMVLRESHDMGLGMQAMQVEPASAGETVEQTLARLKADPDVEYAEVDQRRYVHAVPNDASYSGQWYLQPASIARPAAVDAETTWDTTTGSTGVVIADIDTGIRFDHPDLQWAGGGGRVLPGYDFVSDVFVANDGDGRDADAADPGDWITSADLKQSECSGAGTQTSNSSWHGTRTAGMLGALTNNGVGVAGLTWSTWILPVRALGKCGGTDSDIIAAMNWAAGIDVPGAPHNPYPAKIINMSLGGTGACSQSYKDAIAQITARGVLIVVSAGNEGGPVDSPANCPGVAAIAGLRHAGTKVGYSNLGPEVAVAAPAGNCGTDPSICQYSLTTTTNAGTMAPGSNGYTSTDNNNSNLGTSFAAPIISGISALMVAINGNLGSAQLIDRLKKGSRTFPNSSLDAGLNQPPACHVPAGSNDVQNQECICTNDGQTCGAGMASASGAINEALRPIAAVALPANVTPGGSVSLNATGSAAACGHSVVSYQWTSSDAAGHPVSSSTGPTTSVTAPLTGSFTVTLTVTDDSSPGRTDVATITVRTNSVTTTSPSAAGANACVAAINVPSPIRVSLSPGSANVAAGSGTQSFAATVIDTLDTSVIWQVNGVTGGNATVGTISSSGLYTAPNAIPSPATVTVTAVSNADSGQSGSAQVTVIQSVTVQASSGGGGGGGSLDGWTLVAGLFVLIWRCKQYLPWSSYSLTPPRRAPRSPVPGA